MFRNILVLGLATFASVQTFAGCNCGSDVRSDVRARTLDEWLATSVDSEEIEIKVGFGSKADLKWFQPSILVFGTGNFPQKNRYLECLMRPHGYSNYYEFLSNYYPTTIVVDGKEYKSSEHYYQAAKFPIDSKVYKAIVASSTADEAKQIAHEHHKQANLGDDQVMSIRMKKALWAKFFNEAGEPNALGYRLIATGNCPLIEGNLRYSADGKNISDTRWGAEFDISKMPKSLTLTGKNLLGKLLVELRSYLQYSVIHKNHDNKK